MFSSVSAGHRHVVKRIAPVLALVAALSAISPVQAQLTVTNAGMPSYRQAVEVPPGVAGMAPQLGLSYSGGGVNSMVGYGWSVSGISSITRCGASRATDGARTSITYTPSDKLCLDGQRLIQTNASGVPSAFPQLNDSLGRSSGATEYRTETDSFARIRAYGIAGGADPNNGPAYFRVWTKAGQIYDYGAPPSADANTNALVTARGKSVAISWTVARISDTLGNYIDFKYDQREFAWGSGTVAGTPTAGKEWNIREIQYTGNVNVPQPPANKVVFTYVDRPSTSPQDSVEAYHQGSKNVSVRLLQSISTYVNATDFTTLGPSGVPVKTVKLTYDNGPVTKRSRLTKITECAGGASSTRCMPPTTFAYSAGGNETYQANANFSNSALSSLAGLSPTGNFGVMPSDFNGDGKTDFIRWSDNPADNQMYLSNGDGTFAHVQSTGNGGVFNITDENLFKSDDCYMSMFADFNGDGISDILRHSAPTSLSGASCATSGSVYVYLGNGNGSFTRKPYIGPLLERLRSTAIDNCLVDRTPTGYCAEPGLHPGWTRGANFFLLDVNGDGKLDIITTVLPHYGINAPAVSACSGQACTGVYLSQGDGSFVSQATNLANRSIYVPPKATEVFGAASNIADINGDGLADLTGLSTFYFNKSAGFQSKGNGDFDPIALDLTCDFPLDFNGDGRADCLTPGYSTIANELRVSDGSGTLPVVANFNMAPLSWNLTNLTMLDMNGDGRDDILRWWNDPSANSVYLSNGDGTFAVSLTFNLRSVAKQLRKNDGTVTFITGDFTGRGNVEFLRLVSSFAAGEATTNQLYEKADSTPPDQLLSVKTSAGAKSTLSYLPLSNSGSALGARYVSDRGTPNAAVHPRIDVTPATYVVTTSTADSGVGTSVVTTEHSYGGLKIDTTGHGNLGFRETRRQSPGPNGQNLTVLTQALQDHPYIGMAHRTETRLGSLNNPAAQLLSTTINTYCDKSAAPGAEATADLNGLSCPALAEPVPAESKVKRPYLRRSVVTSTDLSGAALPTVTTVNSFNGVGDPLQIEVKTEGFLGGTPQTFTKTATNQYRPDDTAGDNWVLARLSRSTVQNTVPNNLAALSPSFGNAPNASATAGTLPVLPALPLSLSPSSVSATNPSPGTVSAVGTVTVAGGPTMPLTYSWARESGSSAVISANAATGSSSAATWGTNFSAGLNAGESANETWRVTVTDAGGRVGTVDLPITLAVHPMTASISPNTQTATRGNPGVASVLVSPSVTGGSAPYVFSWVRTSGTRSAVSSSTIASPTFSATLSWAENFTEAWQVTVTDSAGKTAVAGVNIVFTTPAQPAVSASPASLVVNAPAPGAASGTVAVTGTGGTAPYSFVWSRVTGSRVSVSGTAVATFSTTLNAGDDFTEVFRATLTDAAGNTATSDVSVRFTTPGALPAPTVALTPASISTTITTKPSGSVTYTGNSSAVVTNGQAPFTYAWTKLSGTVNLGPVTNTATGTFTTTMTATQFRKTGVFRVTVTDALARSTSADISVSVTGVCSGATCP